MLCVASAAVGPSAVADDRMWQLHFVELAPVPFGIRTLVVVANNLRIRLQLASAGEVEKPVVARNILRIRLP